MFRTYCCFALWVYALYIHNPLLNSTEYGTIYILQVLCVPNISCFSYSLETGTNMLWLEQYTIFECRSMLLLAIYSGVRYAGCCLCGDTSSERLSSSVICNKVVVVYKVWSEWIWSGFQPNTFWKFIVRILQQYMCPIQSVTYTITFIAFGVCVCGCTAHRNNYSGVLRGVFM